MRVPKKFEKNSGVIFDVMYGFIPVTEWEQEIINSPFYQRLRWIKQLGFSNYIFPGAEHNRFAHAIGVMHSMQQMLEALGIAVTESELFDPKCKTKAAMLHKSLRISALLHDIGTFPFSHAIEYAYIKHGNDSRRPGKGKKKSRTRSMKDLPNSHEHLGSFIIKNTNYPGGLTRILDQYGLDVQLISKIIKGESPYLIANQLMHSDLDADRMDYLMRDAHYTGLKYGQFDRDYILANLETYNLGKGQIGFAISADATHAVEDFLIARFNWYSQVIRNPGSAKFDVISTSVAKAFLEKDLIHQFHDLLSMVENKGERFYWWNDVYFMSRCQEIKYKNLISDPRICELMDMLIYRRPPRTIKHELFEQRLFDAKDTTERTRTIKKIEKLVAEWQRVLEKDGNGTEFLLVDIPTKDVTFTAPLEKVIKTRKNENLYADRDSIKILTKKNELSLLVQKENSLMRRLSGVTNFIPNVYANNAAAKLLKQKKLIKE